MTSHQWNVTPLFGLGHQPVFIQQTVQPSSHEQPPDPCSPLTTAVATDIWVKGSMVWVYHELGHRLGLKERITEISSLIEIINMLLQKARTSPSALSVLFLSHCAHFQSHLFKSSISSPFFPLQSTNLRKGLNINACPLDWTPLYSFTHPTETDLFISVGLSSEARIFLFSFSSQEKNLKHKSLYISRQWLSAARKLQTNGTLL